MIWDFNRSLYLRRSGRLAKVSTILIVHTISSNKPQFKTGSPAAYPALNL